MTADVDDSIKSLVRRAQEMRSGLAGKRLPDAEVAAFGAAVRALPEKSAGKPSIFGSPLLRARQTLGLILDANGPTRFSAPVTLDDLREVSFGRALSANEIELISEAGRQGKSLTDIVPGFVARYDVPADLREITDIDTVYQDGETVLAYVRRSVRCLVVLLQSVAGAGGAPEVEARWGGAAEPSRDEAAQILHVKRFVRDNRRLPGDALVRVFKPLAEAVDRLPEGARLVLCRHGDTVWSDLKVWAGGNVDVPLTAHGMSTARYVGAMIGLLRAVRPVAHEAVVVGHSGVGSVMDAALCSAADVGLRSTDGAYRTDAPHMIEKRDGRVTIGALTPDFLLQAFG